MPLGDASVPIWSYTFLMYFDNLAELHQGRRKRPLPTQLHSRPYAVWNLGTGFWWNLSIRILQCFSKISHPWVDWNWNYVYFPRILYSSLENTKELEKER